MVGRELNWVRRLADIPGVGYTGMSEAERGRIPGYNAVPKLFRWGSGPDEVSLEWQIRDGSTSASPAYQYWEGGEGLSTKRLLRRLAETLELPGIASDYHFPIQGAISDLMSRALDEPQVLDDVERLCLLNIALVEARPEAVTLDLHGDPGQGFVEMYCFPMLIKLYEREGALPEAIAVADRARRFGKCEEIRERLLQRQAAVVAEDAS